MASLVEVREAISKENFIKPIAELLGNDSKKLTAFKSSLLEISQTPLIQKCDLASVLLSAKHIAELGLNLGAIQGQAYIVAYRGVAQAIVGYKGYKELAKRAGYEVKAEPVFLCDDFRIDKSDFDDKVIFVPDYIARLEDDKDFFKKNFVGVLVRTRNIETRTETADFVNARKIYKIAGLSPSRNSQHSPYALWEEEMYLAKATKYVLSKMPLGEKLMRAVAVDNEIDIHESQAVAQKPQSNYIDNMISVKKAPAQVVQAEQAPAQEQISEGESIIEQGALL